MKHIKTKALILAIVVGIIIFATLQYVNAEETQLQSLGTVEQGKIITLVQNCLTSTYSNISRISYPNRTFAINSQTLMIKNGDDYSYNFSNTITPGNYIVYGVCDESGTKTNWVYDFYVNPTGRTSGSVFDNSFLIIILGIALLLTIAGIITKEATFGFIGSILFLIIGIYTMIYGFDDVTNMYTRSVAIVFIGIGIVTMFSSAYEFIETGGVSNDEE